MTALHAFLAGLLVALCIPAWGAVVRGPCHPGCRPSVWLDTPAGVAPRCLAGQMGPPFSVPGGMRRCVSPDLRAPIGIFVVPGGEWTSPEAVPSAPLRAAVAAKVGKLIESPAQRTRRVLAGRVKTTPESPPCPPQP